MGTNGLSDKYLANNGTMGCSVFLDIFDPRRHRRPSCVGEVSKARNCYRIYLTQSFRLNDNVWSSRKCNLKTVEKWHNTE